MNDRHIDEESLEKRRKQSSEPTSEMDEIGESRFGERASINSDGTGGFNGSTKTDEQDGNGPDVYGHEDANGENVEGTGQNNTIKETYEQQLVRVVAAVDEIVAALQSGAAHLESCGNQQVWTKGKGKQKPQNTGHWVLQIVYRPVLGVKKE